MSIPYPITPSATRFAVVGPGTPSPQVLLASSEKVSDIVGFYSLREAGLDDIVPQRRPSPLLLSLLGLDNDRVESGYISIDFWSDQEKDSRSKLYSLIISDETGYLRYVLRDNRIQNITNQLSSIVTVNYPSSRDRLIYFGQMISAFLNLANREAKRIEIKRKYFVNIYRRAIPIYIAAAFLIASIVFSIDKLALK